MQVAPMLNAVAPAARCISLGRDMISTLATHCLAPTGGMRKVPGIAVPLEPSGSRALSQNCVAKDG